MNLSPTVLGLEWLAANASLAGEPLPDAPAQTKRFGGQLSAGLREKGKELARQLGAVLVQEEAPDGFGGEWDLLYERADGSRFVIECITGESKAYEVVHVQKAIEARLPYVGLCLNETIRERIRRYLAEAGIQEDGERVQFVVSLDTHSAVVPSCDHGSHSG